MLKVIQAKDYDDMSEKACEMITDRLKSLENPVLGLATGSTPEGLYQRIIEKYEQKEISFQNAMTFNLDEYVGLAKDDPNSYYQYMNDKLFKHIEFPKEHIHIPNGTAADLEKECNDYEQLIREINHIDLQLIGLVVYIHIGFNEPGTPF